MIFAVDGRSDSGHDLGFDSDPVDEAWRWDAVAASVFRQERNAGCDCIARLCCLSWVRLSHPISDLRKDRRLCVDGGSRIGHCCGSMTTGDWIRHDLMQVLMKTRDFLRR